MGRFSSCSRGAILLLAATVARADEPALTALFPSGGRQGQTVEVTCVGTEAKTSVTPWIDGEGITTEWIDDEKAARCRLVIDADAPVGPRLFRLLGEEGVSPLQIFMVGACPELQENESEDKAGEVQEMTDLPVTLNGRLERRGEVDAFSVPLEAGQRLVARLDAYRLDAPMDPLLHLVDDEGNRLAFQHDGLALDPVLTFRAERAGRYQVQVMGFVYPPSADIGFTGSPETVYRLHLTSGPYVTSVFPSSQPASGKVRLRLHGWGLEETERSVEACGRDLAIVRGAGIVEPFRLPVSGGAFLVEGEGETRASVPCVFHGCLGEGGEVDALTIAVPAGRPIHASLYASRLRAPLDAKLLVKDAEGKVLAENDDAEGADPALTWTAKEAAEVTVEIADLLGQGGEDAFYRLEITEAIPGFAVSADADRLVIKSGETVGCPVSIARRHGFDGAVEVEVVDLPAGLACEPLLLDGKAKDGKLNLVAPAEAARGHHRLRLRARAGGEPSGEWQAVRVPLKGASAEAGDLMLNEEEAIWLTVLP